MSTSARERTVHLEVVRFKDDTNERLVKKFIRKYKTLNLKDLFMDKYSEAARFEKKSDKDRKMRKDAKFKAQRDEKSRKDED